jgi:hypothetical protein
MIWDLISSTSGLDFSKRNASRASGVKASWRAWAIDLKELIYLRDKSDGLLLLWIDLHHLKELAPSMGPTGRMHDIGATHLVVGRIAITLEDTLEVAQKPLRPFPFPTESELEDHRGTGSTVLP